MKLIKIALLTFLPIIASAANITPDRAPEIAERCKILYTKSWLIGYKVENESTIILSESEQKQSNDINDKITLEAYEAVSHSAASTQMLNDLVLLAMASGEAVTARNAEVSPALIGNVLKSYCLNKIIIDLSKNRYTESELLK